MASALQLPDNIKEETTVLYRKAMKRQLIKGRSIEELVSAMLYITLRQYNVPRTLKEIATVSRSPLKKIRRAYIFLIRKLEIEVAPADPALYIPRFCFNLGLSEEISVKACEILKNSGEVGTVVSRGGPIGTAAAAICIASKLKGITINESDIAKVAGTAEITIRDRCEELEQ